MANESLSGLAKRWLKAKTTHLTTADNRTRDRASADANATGERLRNDAIGEAILTAVPGLRRFRDEQEERSAAREVEREQRRDDEIAARPRAEVQLRAQGAVSGAWSGTLHAVAEVETEEVDDDPDAMDGATPTTTPSPTLVVRIDAGAADRPMLGDDALVAWTFMVAGYAGPGAYDLSAIAARQRELGTEPDYLDWELVLGDGGEASAWFQPEVGPASVTIHPDGRTVDVRMHLSGANGDSMVEAHLVLAAPVPPVPTAG